MRSIDAFIIDDMRRRGEKAQRPGSAHEIPMELPVRDVDRESPPSAPAAPPSPEAEPRGVIILDI